MFSVPIKLVFITRLISLLDLLTDASAQQSIIKSNFFKLNIFFIKYINFKVFNFVFF